MKNIILKGLVLAFVAISTFTFGQRHNDIEFKKGDVEISLGAGLMNTFIDKNTQAALPPLSLTVGYRVLKTISVGTYLGYSRTNYVAPTTDATDDPSTPQLTNNYFQAGIRGQGHFTQDRIDFYGGAMIGYNFSINDFDGLPNDDRLENVKVDQYADLVVFSGHVGMKYLLTEHLGIYGEVGYGVSIFNLGITSRF